MPTLTELKQHVHKVTGESKSVVETSTRELQKGTYLPKQRGRATIVLSENHLLNIMLAIFSGGQLKDSSDNVMQLRRMAGASGPKFGETAWAYLRDKVVSVEAIELDSVRGVPTAARILMVEGKDVEFLPEGATQDHTGVVRTANIPWPMMLELVCFIVGAE
jgi:hypothetical protein